MLRFFFLLFFLVCSFLNSASAYGNSTTTFLSNNLEIENANPIKASIYKNKSSVGIIFDIKKGNYLYKDKIKLFVDGNEKNINIPNGIIKEDLFYGKTEVFYDTLYLNENIKNYKTIEIRYQGCSEENGICYIPKQKIFNIDGTEYENDLIEDDEKNINPDKRTNDIVFGKSNIDEIFSKLEGNLLAQISIFFIFGLFISLTPCVLPMIPILSSIILSENKGASRFRAFQISLAYVLGTCLSYIIIGISLSLMSTNIQSFLQAKEFSIFIAVILILLSLLLMDIIKIKNFNTTNNIKNNLMEKIQKIRLNNLINVFFVGFLSSIFLSPCVSAPLAAISIHTANNKNIFDSILILLSFGLGSGLILIFIATSLNEIKLKISGFMNKVKIFIAYLLQITAYYSLGKAFGFNIFYILTIVLSVFYIFISMKNTNKNIIFYKNLNLYMIAFFIFAIIFSATNIDFNTNKKVLYLENTQQLEKLTDSNKNIVIKVTAEWCVYCRQMDKEFFNNNNIEDIFTLDLTKVNSHKKKIMEKLKIMSPPEIIIFDGMKVEKIIGYQEDYKIEEFLIKNKVNVN